MAPCECLIRCGAGRAGRVSGRRDFCWDEINAALSAVHRLGFWATANPRYTSQQKSSSSRCMRAATRRHTESVAHACSSAPVAAAASRVTELQPDRLYLYMETPSWAGRLPSAYRGLSWSRRRKAFSFKLIGAEYFTADL
ncbi:hypothetical protein D9C73_026476 [Collichthys lucidus]|uniref:Uncharacterized protein n=1 Tax=Collichthys lucidus TaxID=240159 RepID=A0A4U5VVA6_COLLU|nr:hypothetical protein D9C73_026476 [Collichthys lucidus]